MISQLVLFWLAASFTACLLAMVSGQLLATVYRRHQAQRRVNRMLARFLAVNHD